MTIKQAQLLIISKLARKSFKNPELEARLLLALGLKKEPSYILAHPEKKLSSIQSKKITKLLQLRLKNWPLAYLSGQQEFYGLNFLVNQKVLIPRPETELIITEVIKQTPKTIIDVGTGSGCIIITLAKLLPAIPIAFYGLDISPTALKVAQKNARLHKVNKLIKWRQSNLLTYFIKYPLKTSNLIITANLPYLTPKQIKSEPSIRHEPRQALAAGPDGLKYYRQLFQQVKQLKISNIKIYCEIDPRQTKNFYKLLSQALPQAQAQTKSDLAGLDRLIEISIN